ncbi:MAG TPA: sugar phosphate isomerase/epimerase [Firmicutes bacterium]|nr:sugar phosphate isomerase/epimerase [Bacillota bacterium]
MKLIAFTKWLVGKPMTEVAATLVKGGFDGADLPVREKAGMPVEEALRTLPEVKKLFADHGMTIERLVTDIIAPRPGLDELLALFQELGIRKIRLGGKGLRPLQKAREIIDEHRRELEALEPYLLKHGISGAIQIHSGATAHATMGLCMYCVRDRDPKAIGIQIDTGHLQVAGELPEQAIYMAGPYLHSINLKAIRKAWSIDPKTGQMVWQNIVVPLPDGTVNWRSIFRTIADVGYKDPLSIHPEYRSPYYRYEENTELTTKLISQDRAFVAAILEEMGL